MYMAWNDLPQEGRTTSSCSARARTRSRFIYDDGMRRYETKKPFEGVIPNMQRRYKETDYAWMREDMERYQIRARATSARAFA